MKLPTGPERVLAALGSGLKTPAEIAAEIGMISVDVSNVLCQLRKRGLARVVSWGHVPLPRSKPTHLWEKIR